MFEFGPSATPESVKRLIAEKGYSVTIGGELSSMKPKARNVFRRIIGGWGAMKQQAQGLKDTLANTRLKMQLQFSVKPKDSSLQKQLLITELARCLTVVDPKAIRIHLDGGGIVTGDQLVVKGEIKPTFNKADDSVVEDNLWQCMAEWYLIQKTAKTL